MSPPEARGSKLLSPNRELRRIRDDVDCRVWLVAIIVFWERAAFWGMTAPWQNYMEHPLQHNDQQIPGALGLGQAMATRIYCAFYLFYYTTPIAIAIIADSHLGRYNTLMISVILYCLGCVILTLSSLPDSLERGWGSAGLAVSMLLIGLGAGGFRAITVPFMADQQPRREPRVELLRTGERVVTDYHLTKQYIYNLHYWVGNVGSLSWFATVHLELHVGFTSSYGLTLGFMILSFLMIVVGKHCYVQTLHEHNVLPEATKILLCSCRNGFKMARADPVYQLAHRYVAVSWSGQRVQELKQGLRACRVFLAFVIYYVCFDQMQNNLISQAGQMETRGTPNDLLPAMNQVGCIVFGPLIQEVLYPLLHRVRIYPTPRTRITIGFAFISLSMMYATIVQALIYKSLPCHTQPGICGPNQINVWIQAPVYLLMSIGEIFAFVTALEYANENSPKTLEVVVQAVGLLMGGVGSAIAMALTRVAHDPNLTVFYGSLTGFMAITAVIFWLLFRDRTKQLVTVNITTSQDDAVLGSMSQGRVFQTMDYLPETAPYLEPIDAGGPIVLSCLSLPEFCLHNKNASGAPTLPRQSSRRILYKYAPRKEHALGGVQR